MEPIHLDVSSTLRDRRFLALLAIALLVTYVLPFPFVSSSIQDYSRLKDVTERMAKENDAIVCHNVLNTDPDFFSSHGMECDEKYYRPNESTVTVDGLRVYEDTYLEYLKAREALKRDLPPLMLLGIFTFLLMLGFGYAMIYFAVGLSNGNGKGLKDTLISGFRAVPALALSEILVFAIVLLLLMLMIILMAFLGPLTIILAGFVTAPALALVVPAYYFTKNVWTVGEIWHVVKNNTDGYFALGIALVVVDGLATLQYNLDLGIWMLPLMILIGAVWYPLNSLGALKVYLDAEREEDRNNGEKEE